MWDIIEFFKNLWDIVTAVVETIVLTAERIDSITFEDNGLTRYLGYARYVMGDLLYGLFTTSVLIALGLSLWTLVMKGIGLLRNFLP